MKKPIDVPPELAHLLEKREKEDRRKPGDAQGKDGEASRKPAVERRKGDRRKPAN
jgi:hypothetical protein